MSVISLLDLIYIIFPLITFYLGMQKEKGQNKIELILKFYPRAQPRLYDILTSFIKATWIPEAFTVIPYILITGPKNSGKTRLGEIIHQLGYRGILASNISTATLCRVIELYHPTLIFDEAEIYVASNRTEIQNLMNSGYRKGQYAIRMSGENFDKRARYKICLFLYLFNWDITFANFFFPIEEKKNFHVCLNQICGHHENYPPISRALVTNFPIEG